jgi:hypothetical protein
MSSSQEHSVKSLKLKEDNQARVHSGQMVLLVIRQGGWIAWGEAKDAQRKIRKRLYAAKGPTGQSDSPNWRDNLLSFQRRIKRWDCCWWWWWGENHSKAKDPCGSMSELRVFLFALRFHSQIIKTPPTEQWEEGVVFTLSARRKGGRGGGEARHIYKW